VNDFYIRYAHEIGLQEFVFNHGKYVYDTDTHEILTLHHGLAEGMFMLSGRVYRKGVQQMNDGTTENVLLEIPRAHLKAQFKSEKLVDQIIHSMPLYDGIANIPGHGDNYIDNFVTEDKEGHKLHWKNLYHKVTWEEKEGSFEAITKIIKHIFGKGKVCYKGVWMDEWELGWDYLQLLWSNPTQKLPILTCVSKERNTGKSTIFDFLRILFQQNAKQVREQDFMSEFSAYMVTAVLLIAEEFTLQKMALLQKLKNMVTAAKMPYRAMHKNTTEVDSFLHVGITSNSLEDFTCLDDDEVRFWIREIPVLSEAEFDLDILKKATDEIPALIFFLNRRKMGTQRDSRAWFDFDLIKTDALRKVLALSKSEIEKEMELFLREVFSQTKLPMLKFSVKDIKEELRTPKYSSILIKDCLSLKMKVQDSKWSNPYTVFKWDDVKNEVCEIPKNSIFYKFYISDFFQPAEWVEILSFSNLVELEDALKKANKKSIFPLITPEMLTQNTQIKYAMKKNNLKWETIQQMCQSLTSFAELADHLLE
jgi:hypothetical protein